MSGHRIALFSSQAKDLDIALRRYLKQSPFKNADISVLDTSNKNYLKDAHNLRLDLAQRDLFGQEKALVVERLVSRNIKPKDPLDKLLAELPEDIPVLISIGERKLTPKTEQYLRSVRVELRTISTNKLINELASDLVSYIAEFGHSLNDAQAHELMVIFDGELESLKLEINRHLSTYGNLEKIKNGEDIHGLKDFNVFVLSDAVISKDSKKFSEQWLNFVSQSSGNPFAFLSLLAGNLVLLKQAMDEGNRISLKDLADKLGKSEYQLKKLAPLTKRFHPEELRLSISLAAKLDLSLKFLSPESANALLFEFCRAITASDIVTLKNMSTRDFARKFIY